MTNPKNQIRSYLRSFNYTDDGMEEVMDAPAETGDYVRTSDYLLLRGEVEAGIERLTGLLASAEAAIRELTKASEPSAPQKRYTVFTSDLKEATHEDAAQAPIVEVYLCDPQVLSQPSEPTPDYV